MIDFQCEGVEMPKIGIETVSKWILAVAAAHNKRVGQISYMFCDDAGILKVNREFLQHDYFTDIITFDYTSGNKISGDILISLDTVRSNSVLVGENYEKELLRVIIHGILHLCGINDKGPGERAIMEAEENRALEMYSTLTC